MGSFCQGKKRSRTLGFFQHSRNPPQLSANWQFALQIETRIGQSFESKIDYDYLAGGNQFTVDIRTLNPSTMLSPIEKAHDGVGGEAMGAGSPQSPERAL